MSFTLKLQYCNDEKNKLTKDPEDIISISGNLRDDCSLLDPEILIEGELTEAITKANYMHIGAFHRYYFIKDIQSFRTGLYLIKAHVDVLMTYRSAIKECNGIVHRSKNKWNLYLNDGSFKVYQNPNVIAKKFPSGFSTYEFVLAVAGNEQSST